MQTRVIALNFIKNGVIQARYKFFYCSLLLNNRFLFTGFLSCCYQVLSVRLTAVVQKSVVWETAGWEDLLPRKEEVIYFLRDENRLPYQSESSVSADPEYHWYFLVSLSNARYSSVLGSSIVRLPKTDLSRICF